MGNYLYSRASQFLDFAAHKTASRMLLVLASGLFSINTNAAWLNWTTFHGAGSNTHTVYASDIAYDDRGYVYITGTSYSSWNWVSPLNSHMGGQDAFVAKLDLQGGLIWYRFLGGEKNDNGYAIDVDKHSGEIVVAGSTESNWNGNAVNPFNDDNDAFIARLDSQGTLLWHTFFGTADYDYAMDIVIDSHNDTFVTGAVESAAGDSDLFVLKLDPYGMDLWFYIDGSVDEDAGNSIQISGDNIIVAGTSNATWGNPVNAYAGGRDAFAVTLDPNGNRIWNTFIGSADDDAGYTVAADAVGDIYVGGSSFQAWGIPQSPHNGGVNGLLAKLSVNGGLIWHTFVGDSDTHIGTMEIFDNGNGEIYLGGTSNANWGNPIVPYAGGSFDGFVGAVEPNTGTLVWHQFVGSPSFDANYGFALALDRENGIYLTGDSGSDQWGPAPVNYHGGGWELFVAKLDY